jgi:hypothetical protein
MHNIEQFLTLWGFILENYRRCFKIEFKIYCILRLMSITLLSCHKFSLARNLDPHISQRLYPQMSNTLRPSYLTTQYSLQSLHEGHKSHSYCDIANV